MLIVLLPLPPSVVGSVVADKESSIQRNRDIQENEEPVDVLQDEVVSGLPSTTTLLDWKSIQVGFMYGCLFNSSFSWRFCSFRY
ncbi:hypothetical protein QVD17_06692 [Tagetes erecta]|uniref:Uncharacterized protein n=1 Tax=Tagetes erecta TaxID=13708 RepID=A0AAD8LNX1_TARER|nr:hypothetical protein QVD17_06692 [Tagetes erecta]